MRLLHRYGLHAIVDEIYALTRYGDEPFASILSIPDLPNLERTHFMWGLSKVSDLVAKSYSTTYNCKFFQDTFGNKTTILKIVC